VSSGDKARAGETGEAARRQRLDKWLWFARVVRTRSAAARLVADGYVRVNSRPVENPAKSIAPGDVLTIALERDVRVLRIVAPGLRRGPFKEAAALFEDLSEKPPPAAEG
jgi:ribosome-associated heat shock protein Hsp15